jgi:hypothetical protein
LKGQALNLSTYEKELLSLVKAIQKWRPYLLGQSFKVKTDQQSLKVLLEQKIGTTTQQLWISKLLGYDFVIEYKKGKENRVVDALSRQFENPKNEVTISLISFPTPTWVDDLKSSYLQDSVTRDLYSKLQLGLDTPKVYTLQQGLILWKVRIWINKNSTFKLHLLAYIHANPTAGHSGYHKTVHQAKADFY